MKCNLWNTFAKQLSPVPRTIKCARTQQHTCRDPLGKPSGKLLFMLWSFETEAPGNPTHKYTEAHRDHIKKTKTFDYTTVLSYSTHPMGNFWNYSHPVHIPQKQLKTKRWPVQVLLHLSGHVRGNTTDHIQGVILWLEHLTLNDCFCKMWSSS